MMLGDAEAAEILTHLDPNEVQHLGSAMFDVADVSEDQVDDVFDLFLTKARVAPPSASAPRRASAM